MCAQNYWLHRLQARWSRRRLLRTGAWASAGAAGIVALSCGGKQAPTEVSVAEQETPRLGGVISQRLPTDPPSLDLHQVTTYVGVWPTAPALNQLIQYDPAKPGDTPQDIIPDLAERWEQPDPTTLVFILRKGVKFHDGSDFTAEDVKVQLEWIKRPPQGKTSPRAGRLGTIESIETPDVSTVQIKLSRPTPSLLGNLASHYFAIGQAKDILANGEMSPRLIGTGPFKLKSYQRANFIELERNPNYWKPGLPYLDGLKFFIIPDYTTALTNFLGGQYQLFYDLNFLPADQERIRTELGDKVETPSVPSYTRDTVFMNARRKPYDDIRVRRAINLAIDRDAAISVVKQGGALRGGYMAPKGVWAIPESELRKFDGYDRPNLEEARRLLAAAGVTTPLEASATSRTDFKDFAEFVKDQLARIGINLRLTLADTATAQPVLQRGDFDIGPWTISIDTDDPDATFSEISTSRAVRNWSAVFDAEIDALYEKQSQTFDFAERKKIVQELEKRALSVYQVAVLYFHNLNFARSKSVRNFVFHESLYTNRRMEAAWLKA